MKADKLDRADWLFLGVGWLALIVGCVVHGAHTPMWVDELYSYNLIQDASLTHMLASSGDQADGSPPLYYFLIRPWAALFSSRELSLRLFSSVAFCAAFTLIWKLLRRAFAFWPAAVSLALVVGTSHVIRFENSNVRFYGLLFALISLAVWLAVELGSREEPGAALLIANVAAQAALVLCHPLGGFYSAALLAAVCAGDWLTRRRWRLAVALSYPAGWLALLVWARQIVRQADLNRPHSWVPVPTLGDLPGVLYGGSDFYPLFLLFLVAAAWGLIGFNRPGKPAQTVPASPGPTPAPVSPFSQGQGRQLLIALALIGLAPAFWIFSRVVPSNPLFLSRYLIGTSIGWAIVLAQLGTFVFRAFAVPINGWMRATLAVFVVLVLSPLVTVPGPDTGGLVGDSDLAFGHADLPIVCLRSHDFLPREHYSPQAERYYFLLDWEAASAPGNSRHATVEYKILDALRRHYAGLFHHHIVDAEEFLRTHQSFLVHDVPGLSWVALRLSPEDYVITRLTPDRPLNYTRDGVWAMLLVEKKHQ